MAWWSDDSPWNGFFALDVEAFVAEVVELLNAALGGVDGYDKSF